MSNRRSLLSTSSQSRNSQYSECQEQARKDNEDFERNERMQEQLIAQGMGPVGRPNPTLGSVSQASGEGSWQISDYNPSRESSRSYAANQGPYPLGQPLPQRSMSNPGGQGGSTFYGYGDPQHHQQPQTMVQPVQGSSGATLLPTVNFKEILPTLEELYPAHIWQLKPSKTPEQQRAALDRISTQYKNYAQRPLSAFTLEEKQVVLGRLDNQYRSYLQRRSGQ